MGRFFACELFTMNVMRIWINQLLGMSTKCSPGLQLGRREVVAGRREVSGRTEGG